MTIEDDIAFLERIPVLRRLGAPALRILAIGAEGYRVDQGQVLFNAGDVADGAYAVQQGSFTLRPEFRALHQTLSASQQTILSDELKWLPSLSAFGNAHVGNYAGFSGDIDKGRSHLR